MPKRKMDAESSLRLNIADGKTGKFAAAPALPAACANIRQRRIARGMEQKELAARLGVHKNTVSSWESGRTKPDITLVPAICEALQLSPYELFSIKEPRPLYTPREDRLIQTYRRLDGAYKAHAEAMLASLVRAAEETAVPDLVELRFQPIRLAAGADAGIRDITEAESVFLHSAPACQQADSVYKVNGDSMEPTYRDGDMVLVQHIPDGAALRYGEIGAFAVGNECYIKEYRPDGLHSHNKKYATMKFEGDAAAVYLIGRVLGAVGPDSFATAEEIALFQRKRAEAT